MDIDNNDELESMASVVISWLMGQNLRSNGANGDNSTAGPSMFDNIPEEDDDEEENIDAEGETTRERDGMFTRMRQIFLYESSKELLEQYKSTYFQLLENKEKKEEEVTISDLESMSKTDTNISYCSSWYLETSLSSSQSEPISTDSEVYKISSDDSITENHKHTTNDDCLYCSKTKDIPPSNLNNNNLESTLNLQQENIINSQNENSNETVDVLNNLLLQACILDINDRPMTALVSQVANQMIPQLFNPREVVIIRHFIRYKIRTTIDEINDRLQELSRQQLDIMSSLENEDLDDDSNSEDDSNEGNDLSSVLSPQSSISPLSSPQQSSSIEESQELLSDSPSQQQGDLIEDYSDTQVQENLEITKNENSPILRNSNNNTNQGNTNTKNLVLEKDIVINEAYGNNSGRTVQVLEIINKMVGLSIIEQHDILNLQKHLLSNEEYNEVLYFMQTSEDLSYKTKSIWRKLFSCSYFRHAKQKISK